jgi:hypothetical protein
MQGSWREGTWHGRNKLMSIFPGCENGRRVPPVRSPVWEGITLSLFEHLSSPRTIDDIIEWAAIRRLTHEQVNNMLAWLSFTGKARHDAALGCWVQGSDYASVLESWGANQFTRMEER